MKRNNVYTYGVFDLFHYGHLKALKKASKLGNLIIGVYTDKQAEGFKRKPILNQKERFLLIKELGIGKVVYQREFMPSYKWLLKNNVSIVTKAEGAGWSKDSKPFWPNIKSILIPYTKGISTSDIIKRVCQKS